jgi:hypothetical protein
MYSPVAGFSGFPKRAVHWTPKIRGGPSNCQNISFARRIHIVESSYFRSSDCDDSLGRRKEISSADWSLRFLKVRWASAV